MHRIATILVLLVVVTVSVLAAPKAGEKFETTASVNVRAKPCTDAKILRTLASGTIVEATGKETTACGFTWFQVVEMNGWIASKFLQKHIVTPGGGKSVLLIGDSHTCGTFGRVLDQKLRSSFGSQRVTTIGRAGMSTNSYLTGTQSTIWGWVDYLPDGSRNSGMSKKITPKLSHLLESYKPGLTLVALGANEVFNGAAAMTAQLDSAMRQIKAAGSKCVWIAPPQTRCDSTKCPYSPAKLSGYYSLLNKVAKTHNCQVFKSDPATRSYLDYNALINGKSNKGDGIHFDSLGQTGRTVLEKWATAVFNELPASTETMSEGRTMLRGNELSQTE